MRDGLNDVNHALRELVRLQLAGELAPDEAWRERRQMLASVEESWAALAGAEAVAPAPVADDAVQPPVPASERPALAARLSGWLAALPRRLAPGQGGGAGTLSMAGLLLALAVLTFLYVGSL